MAEAVAEKLKELRKTYPGAVALFATNEQADELNEQMLIQEGINYTDIPV